MKNAIGILAAAALALFPIAAASAQQSAQPAANLFEPPDRKASPPVVLCIDDKPGAGGRPSQQAYAKAAQSGYRSVLTLRAPTDGIDLIRERLMVEQSGLRYFNMAVAGGLPRTRQVDEFLRLARDPANQPMLVNCAFAERIAPLMMMFRIVEQGWTEERAVGEAQLSGGHKAADLKNFARNYLAGRKKGAPANRKAP